MTSPSDTAKVKPEDLQRAVLIALESVEQVGVLVRPPYQYYSYHCNFQS
jgi:hypothetical protein